MTLATLFEIWLAIVDFLLALWLAGMCALILLVLTGFTLAAWDMWRDNKKGLRA